MRAFGLLCLWLLLSGFTPGQQIVALNPQVRPDNASAGLPAVDDNWAVAGYPYAGGTCAEWGHRVPCYLHQSTTRASTAYCTTLDGMLSLVATGMLRQCSGNGVLIEEARTNNAIQSRDLTQAAWVKVGMGTALNATGADGIVNTATTLTGTGTAGSCVASCTVLQTITLGSAADTYSVYLKRVTGSGTVNITINNLAGTTACTLNTASFTRCTVTATLANPVIGVQIATLNDVVVADFNQLEGGAFVTSPIATTTVSASRSADSIFAAGAIATILGRTTGSFLYNVQGTSKTAASDSALFGKASNENYGYLPASPAATFSSFIAGTQRNATLGTGTFFTANKVANGYDPNGTSIVGNNGTVTTTVAYTGLRDRLSIGSDNAAAAFYNGYTNRFTLWWPRLPDATLKAMTQ